MNKRKHLSEKELDRLMEEEPDITIRGYLDLLDELAMIERTTKNVKPNYEVDKTNTRG